MNTELQNIVKEKYPMEVGNFQMNNIQSERRRAFIEGYEYPKDSISQLLKQNNEMIAFLTDIKNDYANGLIEDIEDVAIRAENILNSFESTNP